MSKIMLRVLVSIAVVFFMGLSPVSSAASSLVGTVKSSDGKPLEGVVVSARADGKTFTTSVYTDRDGGYVFPPLEDGQYNVWVQAVGFEAGRSVIKLSTGKSARQDMTLKQLQDYSKQLSTIEWMASMPEDTAQGRRGKRLLGVNCSTCHPLGIALQNRFDLNGWTALLNFMEKADGEGRQEQGDHVHPFIHGYKEELAAYLTRARGPDSPPLKYKPLPRPSGEATQIVVTEYDIPPGHLPGSAVFDDGSDWSQGVPSHYESRFPHDAVVDQQGNAWFSDQASPKRTIGKVDPRTGRVTDYALLDKEGVPLACHDIAVDQVGNIWINGLFAPKKGRPAQQGIMVKFDPRTEKFQEFPIPDSLPRVGTGLLNIDSKGNVWEAVEGAEIQDPVSKPGVRYRLVSTDPQHPGGTIKLDPKTGEYTYFKAVTPASQVYGVLIDAEDNAWFTDPAHDRIDVANVETGKVDQVLIPTIEHDNVQYTAQDRELASKFEGNSQQGPPWLLGPRRGAADKKGNTVWYGASQGNRLLKIDIHTRKVTEYAMPYAYSFPYGVGVDKNHMVWVTSTSSDRIFKFNPMTEKFTAYLLPTRGTDNRFVDVDNSTTPPTLWLAYYSTSKIARIQFRAN